MTFGQWLEKVNKIVESQFEVGLESLSDWQSRNSFDSSDTPEEGASEAVDNDILFSLFFEYED